MFPPLFLCCAPSLPPHADLVEDERILDLAVLGKEDDLRQDLRRLRILVEEREEEPPAMLAVDGQNVDHRARLLLNDAAAEVDGVVAELAVDVRVRTLKPHVVQFEQRQVKLHNGAAHLDGRLVLARRHRGADTGVGRVLRP